MKTSEKIRVVFLTLLLVAFCLGPFVIAPVKDWYNIFIIFGIPTLLILIFSFLSNRLNLNTKPKLKLAASYVTIFFTMFFVSAIALYLNNYSWKYILSSSTSLGTAAVLAVMVNIFVWRKVRQPQDKAR